MLTTSPVFISHFPIVPLLNPIIKSLPTTIAVLIVAQKLFFRSKCMFSKLQELFLKEDGEIVEQAVNEK
jgi:hypothetical protein